MRNYLKITGLLSAAAIAVTGFIGAANSQSAPPFGAPEDLAYAAKLWEAMGNANFTGPDAVRSHLYEGTQPHGAMLETFYTKATIDGHTGDLVIKNNFGPEGVEASAVQADPAKHLGAVTVMFKRESGYDPDDKDWFWAKFLPDGSLDKNPKGMQLAGKVAKGADQGCIACHSAAPGGDFLFTTDHVK